MTKVTLIASLLAVLSLAPCLSAEPPKRLKLAELGAGEWVDANECTFTVDVSARAFSYVLWIRRDQGPGRIVTSAGDIAGVDELLVLYKDSLIPAGRYRQGNDEYVFVGDHRAGPYDLSPYYESWDDAIQGYREGSRWAYWYLKGGGYYIASSIAPDFGPYGPYRPSFAMRKDFFVAQLPDKSYSLDGRPLAAREVFTAGDTLAYTIRKAEGEFLVVRGVTEKGPFQSVEHVTVSEEGWAAIGRYADGTARLLSDSGAAYPVPEGEVRYLTRYGADSWGVVLRREKTFVLWSPQGGEREPVVARTCYFLSDRGRVHTIARYQVEGEHHFFLRELGTAFGPYMYCKLNEALMDPSVTANGWVTPPVVDKRRSVFAYCFGGGVTFIPTSLCEEYPTMVDDGKDVAFVVPTDEQTVWVYWKGTKMGPYRDVMQLAIHSGELLVAAHGQEGGSVLYRNGQPKLTFPEDGVFLISRDGTSNLFRVNREDSTAVYVNGTMVGQGLLLTCGETVVDGVPHWYWMSKEGNEIYLTLYRFP